MRDLNRVPSALIGHAPTLILIVPLCPLVPKWWTDMSSLAAGREEDPKAGGSTGSQCSSLCGRGQDMDCGEEGRMGEVKDSPGCGESSPQGEGRDSIPRDRAVLLSI